MSIQKISPIHKFILKITADIRVSWNKKQWPFLTTPTQKSLNQLSAFLNLYQHEKIILFHLFIFEIQSILESCDQTGHTHFWQMPTQRFSDQLLIFVIMYQHAKNQFISFAHSSDKVNFRVLPPDWPHPFLTIFTPKFFNHILIFVKLYQHEKGQLIPSVHSWDIILESHTILASPILVHEQTKNFRSTISFCDFVSTCKKWACFIDLFWRNNWFKNHAIWMTESILAYISGTRSFPNRGFVQEQRK